MRRRPKHIQVISERVGEAEKDHEASVQKHAEFQTKRETREDRERSTP